MQTVLDLHNSLRERFPEIAAAADREQWGEFDPESGNLWFESLANALNGEMQREVPYQDHEPLFAFMANALAGCTDAIYACIDVSFVENLFWQVPSAKCASYWRQLPASLKGLYLEFHRREP